MDKELPVSAWPEWKIIEKIGEGSFGKVYKAQRTERGKSFYSAIKIINIPGSQSELNSVRSETGDEQSTRQYFQNLVEECIQEISTMEYFRGNSYIVSVEDFKVMEYLDVIGWEISIRMEYLTSFMDYCAEKQLTEKEVIKLGMDLSKALEYCRKLKIIHRDIKPENIFVKDLGLVADTAKALHFPLPLASTALNMFTSASNAGYGKEDDSAVIKIFSGITLPGAKS